MCKISQNACAKFIEEYKSTMDNIGSNLFILHYTGMYSGNFYKIAELENTKYIFAE